MTGDVLLSITIPGRAVGKGRPRFVRASGRTYTPAATASYENLVKMLAIAERAGADLWPGPVAVRIDVHRAVPKSARKRDVPGMLDGKIRPSNGTDIDNQIKSIFDGLNGAIWHDDRQVSELHAYRWWAVEDSVTVEVRAL